MKRIIYIIAILIISYQARSANIYFPPLTGNTWESVSPESLGWDTSAITPLYDFLASENTKAFIVLKDGKIVLEKYFDTFAQDSIWYWASAGKSLTAVLVGIAQQNGLLSINDKSSKYLGSGWTNCTAEQEDKISILNQLTMTTGLDDGVENKDCTADTCLKYLAEPNSRWAYHNAPYTLLEKVIESASSKKINQFTQQQITSKTGISGLWFTADENNVFYSKPRNMARFGLLALNNFVWNGDSILTDIIYRNAMINTSQNLNKSYGYLWWLNGKESYMLPTLQKVFNGSLAPDAPNDMFAAMGKNGQLACISPSKGLVVVRMGDKPTFFGDVPNVFCNQIWQKLNNVMNTSSGIIDEANIGKFSITLSSNAEMFILSGIEAKEYNYRIINSIGQTMNSGTTSNNTIDASELSNGLYLIIIQDENGNIQIGKIIK